jgi:hypothetical protein
LAITALKGGGILMELAESTKEREFIICHLTSVICHFSSPFLIILEPSLIQTDDVAFHGRDKWQ